MKNHLQIIFMLLAASISAQTTLLDAVTHPKFQNPIPSPTKINVGVATTTMKMAQTTQWLGLVDPTTTPLQTTVWGYGLSTGAVSYPGPTLVANSNSMTNIEWLNNLPQTHLMPLDSTYHRAVAINGVPTVVHVHGSHVEAASDGNTEAWYTTNYAEKGPNWTKNVYSYDNTQEAATLWYHDHALGMTRLNVYAGLAGFYLLNDANDQALSLPRGNYDREIVVQDRMFTSTGQFYLPTDPAVNNGGLPEFFGDFIVVNGVVWPYMNVEPRKYRLRLLNGSDSRVYVFSLSNNASFLQIATDDGKLNNPKLLTELTLAPGERSEIIIDFAAMNGQQITLLNTGPDAPFGNPTSPQSDPATTGQIMQFRVNQVLNTAIPDVNMTTATNLRPNLGVIQDVGASMKTRKLGLFEGADDLGRILPMLGIVDSTSPQDGSLSWHDPVTENVNLNDTEIWEIYNTTADAHPVHVHLVSFQIMSKQTFTGTLTDKMQMLHNGNMGMGSILSNIVLTGVPTTFTPAESGWKDTHILMPGEMMKIKARFDRSGEYVWHCHILSHEDHDMMRKLVVGNPCAGDVTPPVISNCPTTINLTTTGTTAIANWTAPTASDNCSTPSVSFTTSPTVGLTNGGAFPVGTTTVMYMAMDANNNMAMCEFNVVVTNTNTCTNDITPPVLSNCPANQNLTTTTTCSNATWTAPTATDNCSTPSVSFTTSPTVGLTNGGCFPIGMTTVTYMAMDNKNNMSTCSFIINVTNVNTCANDMTPPVIEGCPANINVTTPSTCANTTWIAPYATDNCGTPTIVQTAGLSSGSCFPIGTTNVTYTAADATNNKTTCSFTVNVTQQTTGVDVCTNPTTNILGSGNAILISGITTSAATIQVFNSFWATVYNQQVSTTTATIPNLTAGSYIVKVTVLGTGGVWPAVCTVQQTVTVTNGTNPCTTDVTPPVLINCPTNINLTTTGTTAIASWTAPTATDNCSTPSVTRTVGLASGSAFPLGTTTVTYMAMDANNNMATCSFTVTVTQQSTGNDICTSPAANITGAANAISISGITTSAATIQVFNSSWVTVYNQQVSTTTATVPNLTAGNYVVKVTVLKTGGLWPAVCTVQQTVTVTDAANPCTNDVTPPVFTSCPTNISLTTTGTTAVATYTTPTATDNCGTPSVTRTVGLASGSAFPLGTTTVTHMAMDAKNNMATCTFTVTVTATNPCTTDATPPVFTSCPTNISLTTTGTTAVATYTTPTATDNCGTPSVTRTVGLASGSAFPLGTTTVTHMAMDANNNMATCTFTVTVTATNPCTTDATPPVFTTCPTNISLTTTGTTAVATYTAPTATDNCGTPSVTRTVGLASGSAFPLGTTTVTHMAMDAKNNMATCTFTVTVTATNPCTTDATPPVFTTCPTNISLTTTGTTAVATYTTPTATDNCGTPSVTRTVGLASGSAFPLGTTTVTHMAMDAKNNMATCTFTVTVTAINPCTTDATPPVFTSCPTNISLTTTGTTAVATYTTPTATDNCGTPSVTRTVGLASGSAFPLGTTTVTHMAMDAKNNMATCTFTVTVSNPCKNDVTPPVFTTCPANITTSMGLLSWCKPVTWAVPTATDNCSAVNVYPIAGPSNGSCFYPGTFYISYVAADAKGNKSYCNFTVYAYKTLLPVFSQSAESLVIEANAEMNHAVIEWVNNTGYKNAYFTVEKLDNTMQKFEPLEMAQNLSTDDSPTYYLAYDYAPDEGNNTYRVKVTF
ncbi:MAG: HYR domain-containing protein [Saprospiraceae bacterium]|nr:HYR domain-containing protein [Saprospiraceae bacterium]